MKVRWGRVIGGSILFLLALITSGEAQRVSLTVPMSELIARAARDSNDPTAHYEVALGYLLNKQFDNADRELHLAILIEPRTAAAYLALAYLPFARQPRLWDIEEITAKTSPETVRILEESQRMRRLAFMMDPLVDLKVLGAIIPAVGQVGGGGGDYYNILLLGFERFWIGDYAESQRLFTSIINSVRESDRAKKMPDFVYWYRGLAAAHSGDFATAVPDFELLLSRAEQEEKDEASKRLVLAPFQASNHYRYFLATIKQRAGTWQPASDLLKQCLENDLGLFPAHSALASIYESQRQWDDAIVERQRALETNPDDPSLLFDLGTTLARSGNTLLAVDALHRAMEANPRNARIPYLLGEVALRNHQNAAAQTALQRFIAIAPSKFRQQIAEVRQQLDSLPQ